MSIDQATLKQLAIHNPVNDSGAYYPYSEFTSSPPKENKQDEVNVHVTEQSADTTYSNCSTPLWDDLLYTSASLASFEFAYCGDYT